MIQEEFDALKTRVQQGLMSFEAAMEHMFDVIAGRDADPAPPQPVQMLMEDVPEPSNPLNHVEPPAVPQNVDMESSAHTAETTPPAVEHHPV